MTITTEQLQDFLEVFCPLPDPTRSYEQGERADHRDLDRLEDEELQREAGRARLRLLVDDKPDEWLIERPRAICRSRS